MTSHAPSARWPLLVPDQARLEYTRLLWKQPRARARLLRHWNDPRHPYVERFSEFRPFVERVLLGYPGEDDALDLALRGEGMSLRVIVREIPPVFGTFY